MIRRKTEAQIVQPMENFPSVTIDVVYIGEGDSEYRESEFRNFQGIYDMFIPKKLKFHLKFQQ